MTTFEDRVAVVATAYRRCQEATTHSEGAARYILTHIDALPASPVVVSDELRREMA